MNDPNPTKTERLLGIFDIRYRKSFFATLVQTHYEALFRYEVITFRMMMGGTPIIESTEYREEWREITEEGCFPKYKVT